MTAGAPSFFEQEMDLGVISSCLTILVGMTVVLEFSVIKLKEYFEQMPWLAAEGESNDQVAPMEKS